MATMPNSLRRILRATVRRMFTRRRSAAVRMPDPSAAGVDTFHFRPGTMDRSIYHEVVVENAYRLPPTFRHTDVIVDVGCHIGSFGAACLVRGSVRGGHLQAGGLSVARGRRNRSL